MKKYILILSILFPLVGMAQSGSAPEELDSDRPNKTQSPHVIPKGTVQIETGLQYEKDKKDRLVLKDYFYPEALVRIGVLSFAELRVSGEYMKEHYEYDGESMAPMPDEKGFNDVQVGAKFTLYKGKGLIPEIGFLGNVTLPVGNKSLRPVHAAPEGDLLFRSKISEKIELQYNVGYRKQREEEENLGESFYSISGNLKLTDKFDYFLEFFAQKPNGQAAENTVDTGIMYKILPNLRVDAIAGVGVSKAAPNVFLGTGLTWRIPR